MLIEVGIVGCILFFSFFFHIVWTALQYMKKAEGTMKLLLVGIVSALAAIAVHNFGDPFGGHVVVATLWLYAGLILAVVRRVRTDVAVRPAPKYCARAERP